MKNLLQLFSGIKNPQQFLQSMMNNSQVMGNPMAKNAIDMMHKGNSQADKEQKMRDLEAYMKELSGDVTEILSDMTTEERTLLKAKMTTLLQKIG